jgi:predicted nucleotidyltransferase component of viral defense system
MRLKIEINSREHFSVLGLQRRTFTVNSPWYSDSADITVYGLEELLGTKLRALYQRKKGRDLYDLWRVLDTEKINHGIVIECFQRSQVSTTRLYLFAAPKVVDSFLSDHRSLIIDPPPLKTTFLPSKRRF